MHRAGLEIIEVRRQQQGEAALEHVDARIGVRELRDDVAQPLALGK